MIAEGLSQTEGAELLISYRNDPVDSQELTLKSDPVIRKTGLHEMKPKHLSNQEVREIEFKSTVLLLLHEPGIPGWFLSGLRPDQRHL